MVERLRSRVSPLLAGMAEPLAALGDSAALLSRAVADDPPASTREGGMFKHGFNARLDGLIDAATDSRDFLLQLEAGRRSGPASARSRFASTRSSATTSRSHAQPPPGPADYVRRQTTAGGERFVTEALKGYEEKVLTADERRVALEPEIFDELRGKVGERRALRTAAAAVATLDVLLAFATAAAEYGYVRPELDDGDTLEIEEGRHPVVERMLGTEPFVPNDLRLDRKSRQLIVLTGPNMAGKSTVLRQAALIVLMAQAGSFVPARRARVGRCDRIFTAWGRATTWRAASPRSWWR